MEGSKSFFSISFDVIPVGDDLPYDLYINSSSLKSREKFVRIFPQGEKLSQAELDGFKDKYHQLYLSEDQRLLFVHSVADTDGVEDAQKIDVFKNSAMTYLDGLFGSEKEFSTEVLVDCVKGCKESMQHMVGVIKDYDLNALQELIGKLSFHDFYTYDHSINVSMYSVSILKCLNPNVTAEEQIQVGLGGLLHDIGKISIPTTILNKAGQLSDEEYLKIKEHPIIGMSLLQLPQFQEIEGVDFEVLGRVVNEHHENVDGTGYPNKLTGENIHLHAKIVAIADFFDAITTKRSYHEVLEVDKAIEVMAAHRGRKLDPLIFDSFAKQFGKLPRKEDIKFTVADDFDSERPHGDLELQEVKEVSKGSDFGKIKIMGEEEKEKKPKKNFGKIKVEE